MNASTIALNNIKMWFFQGAITYDDAKKQATPHIEAFNKRAAEIAKKHGVKPRQINFASFMR